MPRSGLTKERVIETAAALIDRDGVERFSMHALAYTLNIKAASLYNHVQSMESLLVDVCGYALRMQRDAEETAIRGKSGAAAIMALANAYRDFAKAHPSLYRLIINTAASCGDALLDASGCIVGPFLRVLSDTALTETEKIHLQRVLRAIVHGFVSQEEAGFFAHLPADVEESFQTAIQCYIDALAARTGRDAL